MADSPTTLMHPTSAGLLTDDPLARWTTRLTSALKEQAANAKEYDEHYSGERELAIVQKDYAEVFRDWAKNLGMDVPYEPLTPPRSNLAAVGVDALAERLIVSDWMTPDGEKHEEAAALFAEQDLDIMLPIAFTESLAKGTAFGLVWPGEDGRNIVTIEDPEQVVLVRSNRPPYNTTAAWKEYEDEWDNSKRAYLWLPEGMYRLKHNGNGWVRSDDEGPDFEENPFGEIPVYEIANRSRLLRPPTSQIKMVAPLADNHSKLLADMMLAASFGAIPVRTATGVKLPRRTNPDTGALEPYSPFNVRADRMMVSEDPAANFGMLQAGSLSGYVAALDMLRREVRTVTRVPQSYYGDGASAGQSGETLKADEAPMTRLVEGIQPRFGHGLRRLMTTATGTPVRPKWANTETLVEAVAVDAAVKLNSMGVPLEILLRNMGWDPADVKAAVQGVDQFEAEARALLNDLSSGAGGGDTTPLDNAEAGA